MSNKKFILSSIFLVATTLIASCSSKHLTTNLDEENFEQYFSAAKVKIYQHERDIQTRYQYIGAVEGQDCQVKPYHAIPDEVNARTQARRNAFQQQANGVIFTGCTLLSSQQLAQIKDSNDAQQCHAIVICYARAFAVETPIEK